MELNDRPNVLLTGGPSSVITEGQRTRYLADIDVPKIKIPRGNRYEHFEATAETTLVDDHELRVFVWTHSTYVAE